MLLRVYTQNIDGLEEKAGISPKKVVYAHGSLHTSACLKCGGKVNSEDLREEVLKGNVPFCKRIVGRRKRKRGELQNQSGTTAAELNNNSNNNNNSIAIAAADANDDKGIPVICEGVMKPNIIFFGEPLVDRVRRCLEMDQAKADAVIVIGTSLSVAPISKIIKYLRPDIPRLLINQTIVVPKHADGEVLVDESSGDDGDDGIDHRDGYLFDALMLGFCDEVTKALTHVMGKVDSKKSSNDQPPKSKSKSKSKSNSKSKRKKEDKLFPFQSADCDVLCNRRESLDTLGLFKHPADRVLLFTGAKLEAQQSEELSYHEIVHCDECHQIIKGAIMKCADCFDYDLCKTCHSSVAKKHHDGKHKFILEKQSA